MRRRFIWFLLLMLPLFRPHSAGLSAPYKTETDAAGRKVIMNGTPQRIISLAPANTEILFALGLGKRVLGVTGQCNFPPEARRIDKVGEFGYINLEKVVALRPDLVLATTGIQTAVVKKLEMYKLKVAVLDAGTVDDVCKQIGLVGRLCGAEKQASVLVRGIQDDLREISGKIKNARTKPGVFVEISDNPLYTAGRDSFINDLVQKAGGINIAGNIPRDYPIFSLEALLAAQPDIYLAFRQNGGCRPADFARRSGYRQLKCIKNGKLYLLDADLYTRPGPRVGQALRELHRILHPPGKARK